MNFEQMIAYETGMLSPEDTVVFFQDLIDSGEVWQLQGSYGRMAMTLIAAGYCVAPQKKEVSHEKV